MKSSIQTFIKGVGSILNIFPNPTTLRINKLENFFPDDPFKKDWENLGKDWETIGNDMYKGMEKLSHGRTTR